MRVGDTVRHIGWPGISWQVLGIEFTEHGRLITIKNDFYGTKGVGINDLKLVKFAK